MKPVATTNSKRLVEYLPAIYREDSFLEKYLSAFEKILLGRNDDKKIPGEKDGAETRSLEETIDAIPSLFDPAKTPTDFLPWLASWVALSLRADLDVGAQRNFVANIIQRYHRRGTKNNLIELLRLFTTTMPEIDERAVPSAEFKERHHEFDSVTRPLHFFKVSVSFTDADPTAEDIKRTRAIAHAIIELEKPAHTFYELETSFSSMRIGDFDDYKDYAKKHYRAKLGEDTLITDKVMRKGKGKKHGRS
jgi:phage tail-like protein